MKMYEMIDLANLYDTIKDIKMPLKTTYKFTLLMRQVEKEVNFYQEKMGEIIAEFAQRDENGQYIITEDQTSVAIMPGRENECNNRIAELRNLEVETPSIKFGLEELECLELSISEMTCLFSLIEE